jgi:hypothetical protein
MTRKPGPAQAEEQAELRALRARTEAGARQAGDTLAALTGRLNEEARPQAVARRLAGRLVRRPVVAVRGRLTVAVGVPAGILVIAVAVVLWQHRRAS